MALPIYEYNAAGGYEPTAMCSAILIGDGRVELQLRPVEPAGDGGQLGHPGGKSTGSLRTSAGRTTAFGNRTQQGNSDQPFAAGDGSCSTLGRAHQNIWASYDAQNHATRPTRRASRSRRRHRSTMARAMSSTTARMRVSTMRRAASARWRAMATRPAISTTRRATEWPRAALDVTAVTRATSPVTDLCPRRAMSSGRVANS